MARSKSSQNWLNEHHQDQFVLRAKKDGYRSRAVYKLEEIHQKDKIFRSGQYVVDLGAAPGGWCEYARQFTGNDGKIVAVDILPVDPIEGVEIIQGDFTEEKTLERIREILDDQKVDLVLSDMAPNISGIESVDQPRSIYLVELAVDLASECLQKNGVLVAKLFHGQGFDALIVDLKKRFKSVKQRKPGASRARSREVYVVCRDLK